MLIFFLLQKLKLKIPTAKFDLPVHHKPYHLDISERRGGLLFYIKPN